MLCAAALAAPLGAPAAGATAKGTGKVNVLYAGSLTTVMTEKVGPAFHRATGYSLSGFSGGSDALASQIKGGIEQGDVFISASPSVNRTLEGRANGNWVLWYAPFASSPLEIGYDPHSRFARALRTKPWYRVVAMPGIEVGRTDPTFDPKGVLTVDALKKAARRYHEPALAEMTASTANVFPEESLLGRLQAGQLDAGFFYSVEASAAGIPAVSLGPGFSYDATYTITLLQRAPDERAAVAFVSFLLSKRGSSILTHAGLHMTTIRVAGKGSTIPKALRSRLH